MIKKIEAEYCKICSCDEYKNCTTKNTFLLHDKIPYAWQRVEGACMDFKRKEEPKQPKIKKLNDQQTLF
jgi:hypothetical protein